MKDTWRQLFRRLAAGCVVTVSVAWSSAMCYAVQLAYDDASDVAYADGWQGTTHNSSGVQLTTGDNGGFGFTPWNFDSSYVFNGSWGMYSHPGFQAIDDGLQAGTHYSNPFNNIGKSWDIGSLPKPPSDGAPHIGRGFPALQPGQTLSVVIDNPTKRQFFKGYHVMLNGNSGGTRGNICNKDNASCSPGGAPVNKLAWWRFEYFNYGVWKVGDGSGDFDSSLFDTDTAASGVRLDVTLTAANAYNLTVTPLANPGNAYTHSGTLRNASASLDWIEFVFYNPVTDPGGPAPPGDYNGNGIVDAADYAHWRKNSGAPANYTAWRSTFGNTATPPTTATDFYIRSMSISNSAGSGSSFSTVPEPSTFFCFIAAMGVVGAIPNRRRS